MFCISRERASFALEQLEAEFLLEQLELAADAGLRGMQLARGCGYVQAVLVDRYEIPQLLEFHPAADWDGRGGGSGIGIGYKVTGGRAGRSGPISSTKAYEVISDSSFA
jgi:hypothetical protein